MRVLKCRRTLIAIFSISILGALGFVNNMEVSNAIATVAIGLAAANAGEAAATKRKRGDNDSP